MRIILNTAEDQRAKITEGFLSLEIIAVVNVSACKVQEICSARISLAEVLNIMLMIVF